MTARDDPLTPGLLLTPREACRLLGASRKRLRVLIAEGALPALRIAKTVRLWASPVRKLAARGAGCGP